MKARAGCFQGHRIPGFPKLIRIQTVDAEMYETPTALAENFRASDDREKLPGKPVRISTDIRGGTAAGATKPIVATTEHFRCAVTVGLAKQVLLSAEDIMARPEKPKIF